MSFYWLYSQDKDKENAQNHYNHNFSGLYCTCNQKYPDAENQVPFFSCLNSSKTFCLRCLSVSSVLLSKHYLTGSGWDDSVCHLWRLVPQQSEHLFTSFNWLCSESHTSLTHFLSLCPSTSAALLKTLKTCRRWCVKPAWTGLPSCGRMQLTLQVTHPPQLYMGWPRHLWQQNITSLPFSAPWDRSPSHWGDGGWCWCCRTRWRGRRPWMQSTWGQGTV